jgi:hypothetical protein
MGKRQSTEIYPQHLFVIDKNFNAQAFMSVLPGNVIDSKTTMPKATYKGSHSEDEDFAHILQLAFERQACVITSDYAMIGKANMFHSLVMGFSGNRCMNGVIVLPNNETAAIRAIRNLRSGTTRIEAIGFKSKPFLVDFERVDGANLGINLRADAPTAIELCSCPFTH